MGIQSGPCITSPVQPFSPEEGSAKAASILRKAGVDNVSELQNLTTEALEQLSIGPFGMTEINSPTIDGYILPQHPLKLYSEPGSYNPTELVIGATSFDDVFLLFGFPP